MAFWGSLLNREQDTKTFLTSYSLPLPLLFSTFSVCAFPPFPPLNLATDRVTYTISTENGSSFPRLQTAQ